jgi:hypothetical protein
MVDLNMRIESFLMIKVLTVGILLLMTTVFVQGQAPVRKLPPNINHPSLNLAAPYMSFDGNALLFVSDGGQDGQLTVSYSSKNMADWTDPVDLPKHLITRLNFLRGYALTADGKKMFITCAKSPVIGGYDIFTSDLKGTTWSPMENLMLPINSKTNDGAPSITTDGNALYFMRCDKMDQNNASGCKLFRSAKKPNGQWDEPAELPSHINTGNSQAPRIMADGETLIFSSDKFPGNKGGMDLYLSRLKNGQWTTPIPLDFTNTERDDQYVTVSALGRYLIREAKGARNNYELTEFLIPGEFRPRGLMKVEGKITDPNGAPIPSYISVLDRATGKRIYNGRPLPDGSYFLYLPEGARYELAVNPEQGNMTFFAKSINLTSDKTPQRERVNVVLKTPAPGDEINLDMVEFKPATAELTPFSDEELKRLARLIKETPGSTFEIQVLLKGYKESTDAYDPDLSETREEVQKELIPADTTAVPADSTSTSAPIDQYQEIRTVYYHNDRTRKQADAIVSALTDAGVNPASLTTVVNAIPAEETQPELTIKAVVR